MLSPRGISLRLRIRGCAEALREPHFADSTRSYSISDQYSVAIIHSACVFVGKMLHHIEVRCQLVALPSNSKLRLSDYDVRAWVNRVSRGRGTRPASGMLDNDQIAPQNCPWFLVRHASRKCIKGTVTGTTSALERRFYGSPEAEKTYSTAS